MRDKVNKCGNLFRPPFSFFCVKVYKSCRLWSYYSNGGRHGSPHIIHVGYAEVANLAHRPVDDFDAFLLRRNDAAACAGYRPLRLRGTGATEFKGIAILPFSRSEMTSRCGNHAVNVTGIDEHSA